MHNILIVDDNYANDIKLMLSQKIIANYDLAFNGLEGVERFTKSLDGDRYSLIVMDINMPLMDGIEATEKIRKLDNNIPIIVYSALNVEKFINKVLAVGADKFIKKGDDLTSEVLLWLND